MEARVYLGEVRRSHLLQCGALVDPLGEGPRRREVYPAHTHLALPIKQSHVRHEMPRLCGTQQDVLQRGRQMTSSASQLSYHTM